MARMDFFKPKPAAVGVIEERASGNDQPAPWAFTEIEEDTLKPFVSHWPPQRWQEYESLLIYCRENGIRLIACGTPLKLSKMAGEDLNYIKENPEAAQFLFRRLYYAEKLDTYLMEQQSVEKSNHLLDTGSKTLRPPHQQFQRQLQLQLQLQQRAEVRGLLMQLNRVVLLQVILPKERSLTALGNVLNA